MTVAVLKAAAPTVLTVLTVTLMVKALLLLGAAATVAVIAGVVWHEHRTRDPRTRTRLKPTK